MGLFSSLLGSVPTAARWLIGNSGAIGNVVKAVKDVITVKVFEDEEEDEDGFAIVPESDLYASELSLVSLEKDLKIVNGKLDKIAQRDLKKSEQADDDDWSITKTHVNNLLWTVPSNPVGSIGEGIPSAEMYRDVALILREKGFPLFVTNDKGEQTDVPYKLAQAMLSNEMGKGTTILTKDGKPIHSIAGGVVSKGCTINAQHVYYEIPMGKSGAENVWQATLHMNKSTTEQFRREWEFEQAELTYLSNKKPPTGSVWILTCEIDWRTVLKAKNAGKSLGGGLEKKYDYWVSFSNIEASLQTIKIITSSNVAPAQARASVEVLAGSLSKEVSNPSLRLLDKATEPLTAKGPNVEITNAVYNNDYKETSDYQMAVRRQASEAASRETSN